MDSAFDLGDWAVYLTAPFFTASFVTEVIAWSMAADLVPNPADQAKIFPLLTPILSGSLPSTLGDITAYFVLAQHLHSYTVVWLVLTLPVVSVTA